MCRPTIAKKQATKLHRTVQPFLHHFANPNPKTNPNQTNHLPALMTTADPGAMAITLSLSLSAWRACPPHQWHCFVSPLIKDSYPLQWFFALFFLSFWSCKNFHWILCLPAFSENWILKKRDNASIHVFVCCVVLSFPLQRGGPRCFVSVTASLFVVSPFPYHVLNLH